MTLLSTLLILAGAGLRLAEVPLGLRVLELGLVMLAMTAYLMLANLPYRPIEKDEAANDRLRPFWTFAIKLFGWGLSVLLIGILFLIQHWHGGNVLSIVGAFTTLVGVILLLVYRRQRRQYC